MFDGIKEFVKGVFRRMFPLKTINQVINDRVAMSEVMFKKIELWGAMYQGLAPWTTEYIKSMRLEQGICQEFANTCLLEMQSEVTVEKLDKIYKKAIKNLNEELQSGLALGSFCVKPIGRDKVEYITADKFIPLSYDDTGRLIDVIFIQSKQINEEKTYYRFERHKLENEVLTISNRAFASETVGTIGVEVMLEEVPEWGTLPREVMYTGVKKPDFGYYRNPIKNNIDGSQNGVSIFDSAIEQIKKADVQNARLDWEFESAERAVHVDQTAMLPTQNGKGKFKIPQLNKRLFKGINLMGGDGKSFYNEYSPELREEHITNGLNTFLRQIEFNVSLAYGDISDPKYIEKTATEIKSGKYRKYNMVTAIQDNLKDCLEDLVYALAFYNAMLNSGYEFECTFKDSVLTDEETERAQDRQDLANGVMSHLEYRMKWYGETEEQARKNLPQLAGTIE